MHTAVKLTDAQWAVMVRFRLGLQNFLPGQQCGHVSKSTRRMCNVGLDELGDHACIGDDGGWVVARRNMIRELLFNSAVVAGFVALLEQPILGLFDMHDKAAIWDVELAAYPFVASMLLDCTICHPCVARSIQGSAVKEGFADERADTQKRDRYPGNAGKQVTPCYVEAVGHVSSIYMEIISQLASLPAQRQRARGINSTEWLQRMTNQLHVALASSVSAGILHAGTRRDGPVEGAKVVEFLSDAGFGGNERNSSRVVSEAAAFHALGMSLEEEPCEWLRER